MQYIEYIRLGLMAVGLVMELVKRLKGEGAIPDEAVVATGIDFLGRVGTLAKVKELNPEFLGQLVPEMRALVGSIRELRALADNG